MKVITFAILHGSILFTLLLLVLIIGINTSLEPINYIHISGLVLFALAYIITLELLMLGLSFLAKRRLGQIIRVIWGSLLFPIVFFIIVDYRLFQALGSHLNIATFSYAATNVSGLTPIIISYLNGVTITILSSAMILAFVFAAIGWKSRPVRNRIYYPTIIVPAAFLMLIMITGGECQSSLDQEHYTTKQYMASSINILTTRADQGNCLIKKAHGAKGLLISNLKLSQLANNFSNNEEFFERMENIQTPIKLASSPQSKLDNIVIITLESFRTDSITPYNRALDTTPFLDKLSREGIKVESGFVDFFHTSKSLVSINCGMPPHPRYAVIENGTDGITYPCLPELLKPLGYTSAFFQTATQNFERRDRLVSNMKFDNFFSLQNIDSTGWEKVNYFGIEDRAMINPIMTWVDEQPGPWLLSMVTVTSHHYYNTPSSFPDQQYSGTEKRNKYLNSIRYTDEFLRDLFDEFEQKGLLKNTLFILTGDHGVGLGVINDNHPRKENIQIPLILWSEKHINDPLTVTGPRQHTDIAPTIVDLLDLKITQGSFYGQSLLSNIKDRIIYIACKQNNCQVLIDGKFKFINYLKEKDTPELFDLREDQGDERNLLDNAPRIAIDNYKSQLKKWRQRVIQLYEVSN